MGKGKRKVFILPLQDAFRSVSEQRQLIFKSSQPESDKKKIEVISEHTKSGNVKLIPKARQEANKRGLEVAQK